MAMNANALGDAIVAVIEATPKPDPADGGAENIRVYWRAIAGAIIDHMKTNMDVLPLGHTGAGLENDAGQPVATTGSPSAQTGATTLAVPIIGKGSVE